MKTNATKIIAVIIVLTMAFIAYKKSERLQLQMDNALIMDIGHDLGTTDLKLEKPVQRLLRNNGKQHYGIDISRYQGNILMEMEPKDSLRFLICKATQGVNYVDPDYRKNWREIEEKGLIRGAYHFYVCEEDPVEQANHFLYNVSDLESTDIAPILDIEQGGLSSSVTNEQMENDILIFLKTIEQKCKRKPIIYTDYAFAQEYLRNPDFTYYDLWLAEYTGKNRPQIPTLWASKGFKIWQRSDTYNADHRKTDLDISFGPLSDLVN
jgi:lysozyme